jgi:hypothetical protein
MPRFRPIVFLGLEPVLKHVEALIVIGGAPRLLVDDEGADATIRDPELVLWE